MKEKRIPKHSTEYQKNQGIKPAKNLRSNRTSFAKRVNSVDPIKSTQIPHIEEKEKMSLSNLISQSQQFQLSLTKSYQSPLSNNTNMSSPNDRLAFSLSPSRTEKIEPILPGKSPLFLNKKTLILDLDETLVHSGFKPFNPSDIILTVELEKQFHDIHVLIRPGVDQFLNRMSKRFEIIVFTASLSKYAEPLLSLLDKDKVIQHKLFRENCTLANGAFIKDLKRLGRNMKDNSPIAYALQPENGFPIKSWYDDKDDKELYNLAPLIEFLSYVPDVRTFIPKMVESNEISFPKSMELIREYNDYLRKEQMKIQAQALTQRKEYDSNNKENINDEFYWPQEQKKLKNNQIKSNNDNKGINIKIVNNNYTNYFYNDNSNNSNKDFDQTKIHKRNSFRNSCASNINSNSNNNSSGNLIKSNSMKNKVIASSNIQSSKNTQSKKKDIKKKYMIRLSNTKESKGTKSNNVPKPNKAKKTNNNNINHKINITTVSNRSKTDCHTTPSHHMYNNNPDNHNSKTHQNYKGHQRHASFSKVKSNSKKKLNMTKCPSAKHLRSSSHQSRAMSNFQCEPYNSVDNLIRSPTSYYMISPNLTSNPNFSYNKLHDSHHKMRRAKSSDKISKAFNEPPSPIIQRHPKTYNQQHMCTSTNNHDRPASSYPMRNINTNLINDNNYNEYPLYY